MTVFTPRKPNTRYIIERLTWHNRNRFNLDIENAGYHFSERMVVKTDRDGNLVGDPARYKFGPENASIITRELKD